MQKHNEGAQQALRSLSVEKCQQIRAVAAHAAARKAAWLRSAWRVGENLRCRNHRDEPDPELLTWIRNWIAAYTPTGCALVQRENATVTRMSDGVSVEIKAGDTFINRSFTLNEATGMVRGEFDCAAVGGRCFYAMNPHTAKEAMEHPVAPSKI
jgi:hypothetical protein